MGKRLLLFVMVLSLAAGGCRAQAGEEKEGVETGSEPETEAGAQAESEPEAESENEKESISQARIDRQIFISFNGEIQGFKADSSGLLQNIEQLAYLAPRGGLGMEMEAEKVPESKNPYLAESAGLTDMEEILTSESGLVWVRLFCGSNGRTCGNASGRFVFHILGCSQGI